MALLNLNLLNSQGRMLISPGFSKLSRVSQSCGFGFQNLSFSTTTRMPIRDQSAILNWKMGRGSKFAVFVVIVFAVVLVLVVFVVDVFIVVVIAFLSLSSSLL